MDDLQQSTSQMPSVKDLSKFSISIGLIILTLFIIIIGLILNIFTLNNFTPRSISSVNLSDLQAQPSTLSGTVAFSGYAPDDSYLAIGQRKRGEKDFTIIVTGLTPTTEPVMWNWTSAQAGEVYEIVAMLQAQGKTITNSDIKTVVAPGQDITLGVNSTEIPTNPLQASISGTFAIQGYLPPQSTISLSQRKVGETNFQVISNSLPATDESTWSFTNAQSGIGYELQALIEQNQNPISSSSALIITAPASSQLLQLKSIAQPEQEIITSLSGTLTINGTIPAKSTILIGIRKTGQTVFDPALSNVQATNGQTWTWDKAKSGTSYDIQAYLITNGIPVAQSSIVTATAPAKSIIVSLDAQIRPSQPGASSISKTCNGKNSSGLWQVTLTYNTDSKIQDAQQYYLTLGTTTGGNQLVSNITTPSNPTQSQTYTSTYTLTENATYYAQYAYATCNNCNNFSTFSQSLQLSCP